jgi:hypothetical protein
MQMPTPGCLQGPARDEQRAFWATPRHARSVRAEFSELRTAMAQATALTTLDERPLVVVTARKDAEGGWAAAQNDLAHLSTNSAHVVLDNATHAMLVEDEMTAKKSSQAIRTVIEAVRTGPPYGQPGR